MSVTLNSDNPQKTAEIARQIGACLGAGDTLLLRGPVGAGKTHFARHLIWSLLKTPEDVPSPTFTLVQTYDTKTAELWHADLYRLGTLDEIEELGLIDAFETAICLIEWPELLGPLVPPTALDIEFTPDPNDENARQLTLRAAGDRWFDLLQKLAA